MKKAVFLAGILLLAVWLSGCVQQQPPSAPSITPGNVTAPSNVTAGNVSAELLSPEEAEAIEALLNETQSLAEELEEPQVDWNISVE
ncbi:MAG: hypothetical protein DRP12_03610 [Candidatus Aenigmatarchaeota archaeon]|nr:MAG: hypothetical protein DRP12_03610 [Candidatus Aenigmarchaeota archaeon]